MASDLHIAGLPAEFTKAYDEHIGNGELEEARNLVDREIQRARALLDSINEFERALERD